jgi:6-phospho-3-hexuloisomerase
MARNDITSAVLAATELVLAENITISETIVRNGAETLPAAITLLTTTERVFVLGSGRSGLALRMLAMRLMHLGLHVHIVGDVTTPAIESGDLLVAASGSGTTANVIRSATTAAAANAQIIAITTAASSPLASLADVAIVIPAAQKQDHGATRSQQYSGSLFEQSLLLLGDALFHTMWKSSGTSAEDLWPRHANLE